MLIQSILNGDKRHIHIPHGWKFTYLGSTGNSNSLCEASKISDSEFKKLDSIQLLYRDAMQNGVIATTALILH